MGSTCEMENFIRPDFAIISEDCWVTGEETIEEIVNLIHPTLDSEEKRNNVIDFVQRLIKISLGCEVFSYGSVPLKTYLPDGDIDLTVFSSHIIEETLARDVLALLQEEELKENTEYDVKDPQFIDAEVKLVKCLVQNTVIDISFNQLGGLCTLCFLEQVDRLVGKNHIFKRSIILIKAWCYYESRILGAHHGLISTYALETLILFIFQQFHSSLNSLLAVLHRFLDYYSKFDWDNYCISLNGPICKSSLPGLLVEMPEYVSNNLLLSEEFLRNCTDMFSVPSRGPEINTRVFQQKHLNIIDPLKENNNLGRSVNRANSYRIQRAFKYGARKLSNILLLPSDKIADEINKFFSNTIESHRHNHLADLQDSCAIFGDEDTCSSLSLVEFYADDRMLLKSSDGDFENDSLKKVFKSISNELLSKINGVSSDTVSENGSLSDDRAVSGFRLYRDTYDPSASVPPKINLDGANGAYDCCFNGNSVNSLSRKHYHAPSFHFNNSSIENGNCGPENLCQSDLSDSCLWVDTRECSLENRSIYQSGTEYSEGVWSGGSAISSPKTSILESLSLDIGERDSASTAGDIEVMNPLADLSGDYDSHIRSLLYGQSCCGSALSALVLNSPSSPSQCQNKSFWDTVRQSMPLKQHSFWQTNVNTELVGPAVHHYSNSLPATATFGSEEKETAKGTGAYFLNSMRHCKGRTRNKAPGNHGQLHSHSGTHSNGWFPAFSDANHSEKCTEEISGGQSSVQGRRKFAVASQSDELLKDSHANGFSNSSGRIEFGSLGNLPEDVLSCTSRDVLLIPSVPEKLQFSKPVCGKRERAAEHSLRLKNEDDFPPLSMGKV